MTKTMKGRIATWVMSFAMVLLVVSGLSLTAKAAGEPTNGNIGVVDETHDGSQVTWSYNDGILTISGTGAMKDYSDDTKTTSPWYSFKESILIVEIKGNVTKIGDYAFINCTRIQNINLSENTGLTEIGHSAFAYNNELRAIAIPSTVTNICNYAFYNCRSLSSVSFTESSDISFGASAFGNNISLTSIALPTVNFNGTKDQFKGCTNLKTVTFNGDIPSELANSGLNASVETVIIPNATSIPNEAFKGWTKLASITISGTVTSIGDNAFDNCTSLTGISLPDSLTTIGLKAFWASGLTSITIPANVASIGNYAFGYCGSLASVSFARLTPTSLPYGAFQYTTSLTTFDFSKVDISSVNAVDAFKGSGLTSVTLPGSVTALAEDMFADCSNLTEVTFQGTTLPSGINTSGLGGSVTTVNIPNATSIPDNAFKDWTNLSTANFTGNTVLTTIGVYAFSNTGLTTVTLPASLVEIKQHGFSSCASLTTVNLTGASKVRLGSATFIFCRALNSIDFTKIFGGVGDEFQGTGFTSVTLPSDILHSNYMFCDCRNLTTVIFEGTDPSVTRISNREFGSCSSLEKVVVPDGATVYEAYASMLADAATAGTFPTGVTVICASCDAGGHHSDSSDHTYLLSSDETKHYQTCVNGDGYTDEEAHTYGTGTVTKEATLTETGVRTFDCLVCGEVGRKTEEIPKLDPDKGEVTLSKDKETANAAGAGLALSPAQIESIIFTAADKSEIANGKDATAWTEVKDASATATAADKALIDATASKYTLGSIYDITLWKKIGTSADAKVTDVPGGKVQVSLSIPEDLRKEGRTYKIVRIHGDVATLLDATVNASYRLVFETDKFSLYAIVYSDPVAPTPDPAPAGQPTVDPGVKSPKTGDTYGAYAWLLVFAVVGVAAYFGKKRFAR